MPATKEPRRIQRGNATFLKPGPGERGGIPVIPDLTEAKQQADWEARFYVQYRYVIPVEGGYVVMGYANLWDYFGDPMEQERVYQVDAPGTDQTKKGF